MRWFRRARKDLSRAELLDGLRALSRHIEVHHHHVLEHKPVPKPESATVVFKRLDGSESYRYPIICGHQAYTRFQVPMVALDPAASPAVFVDMEFQWHR